MAGSAHRPAANSAGPSMSKDTIQSIPYQWTDSGKANRNQKTTTTYHQPSPTGKAAFLGKIDYIVFGLCLFLLFLFLFLIFFS